MKKLLIFLIALALLVPGIVAQPDVYQMLTGKQMIGTWSGATGYGPWFGDSTHVYWGTGKDLNMFYNQTSNTFNMTGVGVVMTTATIAGTAVSSGLIADNLITTANKYWKPQAGTGYVNLGLMTGKLIGPAGETDLNVTKVTTLTVNTTSTFTGVDTHTAMPVFNGGVNQVGPSVVGTTASATNDTLTAASRSLYFIGAAAGQRIILPAVSGNTGLTYTFVITTAATGSHLNIIDGAASENINGATTIACATKYAAIRVVCTGTEWVATSIGQVGTWAAYAGA
jgi:hypothetical protein